MLTAAQHDLLMTPIKGGRITKRQASGKTLSYLESWDVRAHLIRVFGFGGFNLEMVDQNLLGVREYTSKDGKPMTEAMWYAKMRLTIKSERLADVAVYTEGAVGTASGPDYLLGEQHDNALKTAASDAMKRCAINLGSQFGLSLYDKGNQNEVVRKTLVAPPGSGSASTAPTEEQTKALQESIGVVTPSEEPTNEGSSVTEVPDDGPRPDLEPEPLSTDEVAHALGATEVTEEPKTYTDAEMTKRRRHMFALFTEAGFPKGAGADARNARLTYCGIVTGNGITSSNDMSYEDMTAVIETLSDDIEKGVRYEGPGAA